MSAEDTLDSLRRELEEERARTKLLQEEVKQTRLASMQHQKAVEEEEEYLVNQLTKKMETIKREKEQMALAIEQEEEALTNMLQKKLQRLQKDKIDMENELEAEEEYITNKLTKQLAEVQAEKRELERRVEAGSSELIHKLEETIARLKAEKEARKGGSERSTIATLNLRILDLEGKVDKLTAENAMLVKERTDLERLSFLAQQRAMREREKLDMLITRQRSESVEDERQFERLLNNRRTSNSGNAREAEPADEDTLGVTRGRRGSTSGRRTRSAVNMGRGASMSDVLRNTHEPPLRMRIRQVPVPVLRPLSPNRMSPTSSVSPRRSPRGSPRSGSPRSPRSPRRSSLRAPPTLFRGASSGAILNRPVPTQRDASVKTRGRSASDSSEEGGISIGSLTREATGEQE